MKFIDTSKHGLSNFVLKIIALISMTFDHVGFMLMEIFKVENLQTLAYIFRAIGRISMPIFIFVLIEGLMHTKNIKKYLLRLGSEAFLIYIAITLIQVLSNNTFNIMFSGNIFITLFVLALFYYLCFCTKYKFLAVLPVLYIILNLATKLLFIEGYFTIHEVKGFIYFNGLFLQYDFLASFLFFGTLVSYKIYDNLINKRLSANENTIVEYKKTTDYQRSKNSIVCILIAFLTLVCYVITYLPIYKNGLDKLVDGALQSFMFISILALFFYNGRKGYSNKVVQYGFYLYYPLHIVIIYLIFYLIF